MLLLIIVSAYLYFKKYTVNAFVSCKHYMKYLKKHQK